MCFEVFFKKAHVLAQANDEELYTHFVLHALVTKCRNWYGACTYIPIDPTDASSTCVPCQHVPLAISSIEENVYMWIRRNVCVACMLLECAVLLLLFYYYGCHSAMEDWPCHTCGTMDKCFFASAIGLQAKTTS